MSTIAFVPIISVDRLAQPVHLKLFSGRPRIYWSLQALSRSGRADRVVVYTNDDRVEDAVLDFGLAAVEIIRTEIRNPDEALSAFLKEVGLPEGDLLLTAPTASLFLSERQLDFVISELQPDCYPVLSDIRMLLTDVDGVLTDAGMYYGESGEELKKFNTRDGMAFKMLRERGLKIGIITGEDTEIVARRARKLGVDHLYQGILDKLPVVNGICAQEGIELSQVAYVGDDIGDLTALSAVGFAACPSTAEPAVKRVAHYLCERGGGEGCVREVAELILAALDRKSD